MTWEIGPMVEAGEVINTCPNQVHGWLRLVGVERPVYLNLTGNMSTDLAGRRLTFVASTQPTGLSAPRLSRQQIGPTGDMTQLEDGQLLLEWHGQNGHVLGHLRPIECETGEAVEMTGCQPLPAQRGGCGLFRQLASLTSLDVPPERWVENREEQFALLDALLEDEEADVPIRSLVSPLLELPPCGVLHGPPLDWKIKEVLAHLSLLGVCLEMCHHFLSKDAYLFLSRMLAEDKLHPQSPASGYVTHYLTFEHCRQCLADAETWVLQEQPSRGEGVAENYPPGGV